MSKGEWQEQAACRGVDLEVFFPHLEPGRKLGDHLSAKVARAKSFCHVCPVRQQCLALALTAEGASAEGLRFGVFGGLTPNERAALRPKMRETA